MSHRSGTPHPHSDQQGLATNARGQRPAGARRRADYTLLHAGRQLRLGPIAFWIAVGTLVIMAGWTISTATYFAFRDDVLTRLIAHQAEMQFGYEDRIAELRAQIDRLSSRQLLDQEQYEQKLDQILSRQATLESRAAALNALPDPAVTGSIKPPARGESVRMPSFKPSPMNDSGVILAPSDRRAGLLPPPEGAAGGASNVDGALARLQASLDRVEARQAETLNRLEASYDARTRRIRGVLAEIGVNAEKLSPPERASAIGGPFVAARPPAHAGAFERQIYRVSIARMQVDRLIRTLASVPVRKPVMGEIDMSSGFGVRIDPFNHASALHTGIDFRGETGDPARATAGGKVTIAGWNAGYGKMVEIDHGNGLATRYGHLSAIEVHVGQAVKIGQVIGRVGSTGRSTGPHLHYETRIRGEAVDPQKFLRAGARLGAVN